MSDRESARWNTARPYRVLSEAFVFVTLMMQFGCLGYYVIGDIPLIWFGLCAWGAGLVLLAPVGSILHVRISLAVTTFVLWVAMSYFYTSNLDEWRRTAIRLGILPILLMTVMAIIGFDRFIVTLKRLVWTVIAITVVSCLVAPASTTRHLDPTTGETVIPGWHGLFDHKNGLMLFLLVGLVTFLSFERNVAKRNALIASTLVLGALSQSSTAVAVMVVLLATSVTLRHFQEQPTRHRTGFLAMMIVVWSAMATVIVTLAATLVSLSGKDLTFSGRTKIWAAVTKAIEVQPLKGYGAGSVWVNDAEPTGTMRRQIGFAAGNAHQGALELLLQFGVIGLTLYTVVLFTVVGRAWAGRHRAPATARWAVMVVASVVLWSLSESATMGPLFSLLAIACVMSTDRDPDGLAVPLRSEVPEPVVREPL